MLAHVDGLVVRCTGALANKLACLGIVEVQERSRRLGACVHLAVVIPAWVRATDALFLLPVVIEERMRLRVAREVAANGCHLGDCWTLSPPLIETS